MKKTVCLILIFALLTQLTGIFCTATETQDDNGKYYSQVSVENWCKSFDDSQEIKITDVSTDKTKKQLPLVLNEGSLLSFSFIPKISGEYCIVPSYRISGEAMAMDYLFDISVKDESYVAQLPILWYDTKRNVKDKNNNEISPTQNCIDEFVSSPFLSYKDVSRDALTLSFEGGKKYTVLVKSTVSDIELSEIKLCLKKRQSNLELKKADSVPTVTVEGEEYSLKSDSYIRSASVRNAALYPYNTYYSVMNVLDGSTFSVAGQKVIWEFEINKSGCYSLGFRCKQNEQTNRSVFRKIEIDGIVPNTEFETARFDYTGSTGYKNTVLNENKENAIFLEKGKHTIALTVTAGPYEKVYNEITSLMAQISEFGALLNRMTAGNTDRNRTWDMKSYMPDAVDKIKGYAKKSDEIFSELSKIEGEEPIYASDLQTVSQKLLRICKSPETIPNKSEEISRGDSSATKYLGNVLSSLSSFGLSIDRIYFFGREELPKAKIGFWRSIIESVKRFIWSYSTESNALNPSSLKDKKELTVWTGQSALMNGVMQQIVDERYNKQNSSDIKLVVCPSEQKLVLANAAGNNPDVVLSTNPGMIYTFALRGAAKNLLDYGEFLPFYNKEYKIESLVSTSFGDGVYGAVDSRNFQLLFYRKDILDSLNLKVPDTWDDVKAIMPSLLRNQMNFFIPISSPVSMKGLGATSPYIYQNGGEIFSRDGASSEISSSQCIKALNEMTEFYKIYGMQQTVSSFYNSFRYGDVPIGIGDFNFYLQLSLAAPEIAGNWDIALTPGTMQNDGKVLRYQPANNTACMIFKNTEKSDKAWDFLKWWLSSDTQLEYSVRRCTVYGKEYQWNTANVTAFKQLPFDKRIKDFALMQWEHQREVTPHPASYIAEREISNVWNNVVVDNKALIEEIDSAVILSDREIIRKMQEFGYMDKNGRLIKEYNTGIIDMLYENLKEE